MAGPFRHARDGRRRAATWQTTVPGFPAGDRTKAVTGALVDAGATGHAFPWRGFPGREEPGGVAPAAVPCSGDRAGGADGPGPRVFVIFMGFHIIFCTDMPVYLIKKFDFF